MPKAKDRVRDRRGERFPKGKRRLDPWLPVPPVGSILVTTRQLNAWWGSIGPGTPVRVVSHTAEEPGDYGPGVKVVPADGRHPLFRPAHPSFAGKEITPADVAIYVGNGELRTHVRSRQRRPQSRPVHLNAIGVYCEPLI